MKKSLMVFALAFGVTSVASAAATLLPTFLTSYTTDCSDNDCRAVVDSKDDAAEFLATNGEVRSAKLQSAFNAIRAENSSLQASDLELAEAILALQ